ncbi:MAG: AfsR/SARP family transcriptional regulator [Fimbriimonadaceae bacterium]
MPISFEIRLLGDLELAHLGVPAPSPRSKKARVLVTHLALNPGRLFLREDVAAHLWPDQDARAARFNLRQLVARIRREAPDLSPMLAAEDRRSLHFEPGDATVDAREFKRLATSEPESALKLYRGPLGGNLEDSWLDAPRAELEELYIRTLETLADRSEARDAVILLRRALEADPYREVLQQKLLSRLGECGDLAGAQVAYRTFHDLLHRELHAKPSEDTERLYRRLLSGEGKPTIPPPSPPALRYRIPVPATEILGRGQEIADVCELLQSARLVTLLGPGGGGKTRLAIAVGTVELGRRDDGVWFVDFSSVSDGKRVPQTVGQSLGLREPRGMGWAEAIAEYLAPSTRLLILDNCEHVVEACSQIAETLLSRSNRLTILATSRLPLAAPGEQRFTVPSLELPWDGSSGDGAKGPDYLRFSALQLFEARARLAAPKFAITPANAATVVAICREVDAMPLGIEMAAARLGALPLEEIARHLDDKLTFLKSPARTTTPRHQTLGAVIEWSYDLLSAEAKSLFSRLSVFSGGWTLAAAETVCGFGEVLPAQTLDTMVALVEASLVQRRDGRYHFLESVHQFATLRLAHSADRETTQTRHLAFFSQFCDDAEGRIRGEGPDGAALHYRPELDNIRAALGLCVASGASEAALQLVADASTVFSIVQLDDEAVGWLQRMLSLEPANPASPARIAALRRACTAYHSNYADFDQDVRQANTIKVCEELIALAERSGDRRALAGALTELGVIRLGWDSARAVKDIERALAISQSMPDGGNASRALSLLARHAENNGDFEAAAALYEEAWRRAEADGDIGALVFTLQAEAHLLREHGRYEAALSKLADIERLLAKWRDSRASAFNNLRFAELFLDMWRFADLADHLTQAAIFFQESRSRFHGMLVDGLFRYSAAFDGRPEDAVAGMSDVIAKLVADATRGSLASWHGACIELEALALAWSRAGRADLGARAFGAAQALRRRGGAFLSPSVQARWQRLREAASFGSHEHEVEAGRAMTPNAAIAMVEEAEKMLCLHPAGPKRPNLVPAKSR